MSLIIDCHGHYTTAPPQHDAWRDAQKAAFKSGEAAPPYPEITDDDIRETIEQNQLRLLKERGADMTIFSPRASTMAHHVGDEAVSLAWSRVSNDLIARVMAEPTPSASSVARDSSISAARRRPWTIIRSRL